MPGAPPGRGGHGWLLARPPQECAISTIFLTHGFRFRQNRYRLLDDGEAARLGLPAPEKC